MNHCRFPLARPSAIALATTLLLLPSPISGKPEEIRYWRKNSGPARVMVAGWEKTAEFEIFNRIREGRHEPGQRFCIAMNGGFRHRHDLEAGKHRSAGGMMDDAESFRELPNHP